MNGRVFGGQVTLSQGLHAFQPFQQMVPTFEHYGMPNHPRVRGVRERHRVMVKSRWSMNSNDRNDEVGAQRVEYIFSTSHASS